MPGIQEAAQLIRQEIKRLQDALDVLEGGVVRPAYRAAPAAAVAGETRRRGRQPGRQMSEEAKQRIRDAQSKRWATHRAQQAGGAEAAAQPALFPAAAEAPPIPAAPVEMAAPAAVAPPPPVEVAAPAEFPTLVKDKPVKPPVKKKK